VLFLERRRPPGEAGPGYGLRTPPDWSDPMIRMRRGTYIGDSRAIERHWLCEAKDREPQPTRQATIARVA
jgi:hypothetical protein